MNPLHLDDTQDTPKVTLNKSDGIFELSGRSLPEDAVEFYAPVLAWIKEYTKAPNAASVFTFKLEYFNTASSKLVLDVLNAIKEIKGAKVVWHHYEDDEDILEAGKEFAEQVSVPFEFKVM